MCLYTYMYFEILRNVIGIVPNYLLYVNMTLEFIGVNEAIRKEIECMQFCI